MTLTPKENIMPRRADINRNVPAELAILDAMSAVEKVAAHPLLTDAVVLLSQAKNKVADYVDGVWAESEGRATVAPSDDFRALRSMVQVLLSCGNDLAACIVGRDQTPVDYVAHTIAEWDKENKEAWHLLESCRESLAEEGAK